MMIHVEAPCSMAESGLMERFKSRLIRIRAVRGSTCSNAALLLVRADKMIRADDDNGHHQFYTEYSELQRGSPVCDCLYRSS